jgi:hypothetical protein
MPLLRVLHVMILISPDCCSVSVDSAKPDPTSSYPFLRGYPDLGIYPRFRGIPVRPRRARLRQPWTDVSLPKSEHVGVCLISAHLPGSASQLPS